MGQTYARVDGMDQIILLPRYRVAYGRCQYNHQNPTQTPHDNLFHTRFQRYVHSLTTHSERFHPLNFGPRRGPGRGGNRLLLCLFKNKNKNKNNMHIVIILHQTRR